MYIQAINNTTTFGYNKQLNDRVNKKLETAKGNKELANTLLELNKFTNQTEDKLRLAEKNNNQRLIDAYADIFMEIKPVITTLLDNRFPNLNYRHKEIETYKEETKKRNIKDEFHWLKEITEELVDDEEFFSNTYSAEGSLKEASSSSITSTANAKTSATTDVPKQNAKKKGEQYVEKFEPTEYSPKGFDSLGGMQDLKSTLFDKIIFPLYKPDMAKLDEIEYGKKAPRGELLYGPPGCGKTAIMQALSAESKLPLYMLKVSKAGSAYINRSAMNIQQAYEYVAKIAEETHQPVLLAMDEMESLTTKRNGGDTGKEDDKVVSTLLQIIEEARGKNVIILGATNCFDQLDDAIKSRFDDKIYIGLPDDATRKSVLKILLNRFTKGKALAENDEELNKVVALTKGFSNRDLTILTSKAALIARNDNRRDLVADDFVQPVKENQNMKVKENLYQAKQTKPAIGFANA